MLVLLVGDFVLLLADSLALRSWSITLAWRTGTVDMVLTGRYLVGSTHAFGAIETAADETFMLPEAPGLRGEAAVATHSAVTTTGEQVIGAQLHHLCPSSYRLLLDA